VNCRTGDSLAQEQITADSKERVLKALGEAAAKLRNRLGESLSTVQKFDTPVEQATTPSLEALQAYNLGWKAKEEADFAAAVPFFQRAIRLDPNFVMAYATLGMCYAILGETSLGAENAILRPLVVKRLLVVSNCSKRPRVSPSTSFVTVS
jgi:Flp pilus assembly protein TadD